MHDNSKLIMNDLVNRYLNGDECLDIIDIGSYGAEDVGGSYKEIFNKDKWSYTGLDIIEGENVDIVAEKYNWPLENESYDVVISGQCIEHVEAPWLWIKEIERICKPDGIVIIIGPFRYKEHRYPVDCWRILPDGMRYLLGDWCNFEVMETKIAQCKLHDHVTDCYIVGKKYGTDNG